MAVTGFCSPVLPMKNRMRQICFQFEELNVFDIAMQNYELLHDKHCYLKLMQCCCTVSLLAMLTSKVSACNSAHIISCPTCFLSQHMSIFGLVKIPSDQIITHIFSFSTSTLPLPFIIFLHNHTFVFPCPFPPLCHH